jgi:hypothetical protein
VGEEPAAALLELLQSTYLAAADAADADADADADQRPLKRGRRGSGFVIFNSGDAD